MRRLAFIALLIAATAASAVTTKTCYVNTGSSGGNGTTDAISGTNAAYVSQAAAAAAEKGDLTAGDGTILRVSCARTNGGGMDTTQVNWADGDWTTSATCYIEVFASDFPTNGKPDATKYVFHNNDGGSNWVFLGARNVRYHNMQFKLTTNTYDWRSLFTFNTAGTTDYRVYNCIFTASIGSSAHSAHAFRVADSDVTLKIWNCTFTGYYKSGGSDNFAALYIGDATSALIRNCTIWGNCYGVVKASTCTPTVTNCAVFDNDDDFSGSPTVDYCASDDGDGTHAQDFTAEATDWNKVFTDYSTNDVTLLNYVTTPCCKGQGTAPYTSTDICGTTFTTNDIGAFAYPASASVVMPILHHKKRSY